MFCHYLLLDIVQQQYVFYVYYLCRLMQYSGKNLTMTFNNHMFVNTCCMG